MTNTYCTVEKINLTVQYVSMSNEMNKKMFQVKFFFSVHPTLVGAVLLSEHLEFAVKMFSVESCSIQEACFNHWHCMGQSRDCYSESIPHAMFTITGL